MPENNSSLLDMLSSAECWESFYKHKTSLACPKRFAKELRGFIDSREYLPVCERIAELEPFPLPHRREISKLDSSKKRVIYIYPRPENTVLKLLTYLLLRRYDGIFTDGLYSFRPDRSAQKAVARLSHIKSIGSMYCYKADISNYFNSVDISLLLPMLERVTGDDRRLFEFLRSLLTEERVLQNGRELREQKGIMAGTPLASFYANLYLLELDRHFAEVGIPYARYSDDIILFGSTPEEVSAHAEHIRATLAGLGLSINPEKEGFTSPDEGWVFLGLKYRRGVIDIAPASVTKLKAKLRRKTRALRRWQQRSLLDPEKAATAFIRIFNRKLFECTADNELSWALWYFPAINTAQSLRIIDRYAQDCLRYLLSGRRTKSRYNVRYEQIKALGLRNLVNEYYKHSRKKEAESNEQN